MCNLPILLRDSGNSVVLVCMQVSWFCSLSLSLWMALEETSRHWMFFLSSCSLAEKAHHQLAVTSPVSIFGALTWKMFKVPYCVYFVLPSTIPVTGSLTLGNCHPKESCFVADLDTSRFQQWKVSTVGLGVGNFNLSFFPSLQVI